MPAQDLIPATGDRLHDDVIGDRLLGCYIRNVVSNRFVCVGDHMPERRINHDPCAANPSMSVEHCRLPLCRDHGQCCEAHFR